MYQHYTQRQSSLSQTSPLLPKDIDAVSCLIGYVCTEPWVMFYPASWPHGNGITPSGLCHSVRGYEQSGTWSQWFSSLLPNQAWVAELDWFGRTSKNNWLLTRVLCTQSYKSKQKGTKCSYTVKLKICCQIITGWKKCLYAMIFICLSLVFKRHQEAPTGWTFDQSGSC